MGTSAKSLRPSLQGQGCRQARGHFRAGYLSRYGTVRPVFVATENRIKHPLATSLLVAPDQTSSRAARSAHHRVNVETYRCRANRRLRGRRPWPGIARKVMSPPGAGGGAIACACDRVVPGLRGERGRVRRRPWLVIWAARRGQRGPPARTGLPRRPWTR